MQNKDYLTDIESPSVAPPLGWRVITRHLYSRTRIRLLAGILFTLIGAFILLTFKQHGISNDEAMQHRYGQLLLSFYTSGFEDMSAFNYLNLYLYGGFFDVLAASLEPWVPLPVWDLRHLLSALFGLAGIVATWKLARLLAHGTAGTIAVILLVFTGGWFGAIFTHTKDIPFATCMTWALYWTTQIAISLPRPPRHIVIKLGLAVGFAFGLRVGALFAVLYLAVVVTAAALLLNQSWQGKVTFLLRSTWALTPAGIIAFILMGVFWPWSVMAPGNLFNAATVFSHFTMDPGLKTIFDGQVMAVGNTPGSYLPIYLWIRLPELLLLGLACVLVLGARSAIQRGALSEDRQSLLKLLPTLIAAMFPLGYALITAPALYNGIRHFLFVVPALAVLAAVGFRLAWREAIRWKYGKYLMGAIVGALAVDNAVVLVRLHPYEYVFYNRFAGTLNDAAQKWEMDYWSSSLREASILLNDYAKSNHLSSSVPYEVAVCAESIQASAYLAPAFRVTRDWRRAHFFLSSTQMNCDKTLDGPIIGAVSRLGTTLAVIRDHRVSAELHRLRK